MSRNIKKENRKRRRASHTDDVDTDSSSHQEPPVQQQRPWNPKGYDYDVEYNDHFETPLQAYQDLLPLLDAIKLPRQDHIVYDPYYCNGQTKRLLQSLGFAHVLHDKRDFYKDIAQETVPLPHETFVTNPPYSDQHKEKCLQYCFEQLRENDTPFFLLMPTYVAAKHYYRRLLEESGDKFQSTVAYLVPSNEANYHYSHPEGTGHDSCPFPSMWFCGVGRGRIHHLQRAWKETQNKDSAVAAQFIVSYQELVTNKIITLNNRPNPRQRHKKRKKEAERNCGVKNGSAADAPSNKVHSGGQYRSNTHLSNDKNNNNNNNNSTKKKSGKSKYRDDTGQRRKKRF